MARKAARAASGKGKNDVIAGLKANPSEENWKKARVKILKEGKYYYAFYPNGIKGSMSLKGAYAVIYDGRMKSLYNIPVIKTVGKRIEGATIYLKGLEINRSIIKG
jgi:hypothetical protein